MDMDCNPRHELRLGCGYCLHILAVISLLVPDHVTAQGIEMVSGVPVFIGIDPVGIDRGFTVPDPTNSGNEAYETSSRAELVQSNRTTPKSYNGHKVTESVSRTEVPPTQEKQGSHTARPHATDSIAYTHNSSVVPDGSNSLSNSPDISLSSTTTTSGHQSTESKPVTSDTAINQTDTMASEESTHTTTTRERQAFSGIVTTSRPTTLSSVEVMTSRFSQGSKNATFNFTSHHSTSLPTKTDTSPTSAKGYRSDKSTITYLSTKASSATNPTSVKPVQRSSNLIHLTSRPISPTTTSVIGRIPEVSAPPSTSDASTVKLLVAVTASNAYTTVAREERTAAVKTHGFKTTAVPTVSEQDSRSTLAAATSKQEAKDPTLYWSQTHMDTEPATAPSIGHATGRYTPTVAFNPNGTSTTSERLNDTIRTSQDDPKRHSEPPTTATQKGDSRTPSDQRYNIATTSRPVYERSLVSERTERQMVGRTSRPNIPDSTNSGFNTKQMFVEVSTERNTDKLTIVQDPLSSTTSVLRDKSTSISNTDVTLSTVKPQPRVVSSAEMVTGQTTSSSVKASASSAAAYPLITTIKLLSNVSVSLTNAKMENTPSTASASEVSNMTAPHGSVKFGLTTAEKSVPTVTPIDISTRSSNGALSESSTGTRHQSPYDTTSGGIWLTSSRRSATREASKDLSATSPHVSTTVRITEHVTNRSLTESVGTLLTTQRPALPSGPHAEKINVTDKQVTDMLEISTASFRTDLNISTSSPREHAATTSASYVQGDLSSSLTTIISMFKTYSDKGTKTPVDRVSQTVSQISTVPGISENTTQLNESVTSAASASKFIVTYPVEVRENATVPSTSQDEDIFTTRGQNANIATNFTQSLENGSVVTFPSVTLTAGRSSLTGNFSDPTTPNINVKPYTTGPLLHNLTTYGAYEVHVTTEPLKPTKISTIQSPVSNHSTILESRSPVSYTTLSSIMATWRENTSSSVVSSNSALQSSTELGFSIRQSGTESRYHVLDNVTSSAPRAFSVSGSKEVVLNVTAPRVESSTLGMLYGNASTLGGSSAIVTPTPDANFTSSQALLNVSGSTEDTHSNASSLGFTSSPILNSTLVTDVSYGPGLSGYTDVSTKNTGLITSNMPTNSSSPNGASNIPIKLTTEGLEQKNASSIESQVSVSVSDSMSPHQEKITFSSSPPHHPESATSSTSQDQNASAAFAYNSTYYVPPGTATTSEPSFFPHIGITTSKTSYSNKSSLVTQVQTSGTPSPVSSTRSPFIPDTLTSRISFQPQNNFSRTTPASEYSNDTYFESSSGSIQPEVATVSSKHASGLLTSTPGIGNRTVSQPSAIYTSQSVDANITIRTTDTYPTQGSGKPTVLTESGASGPPPSPESDLSSYSPMASTASEESGKQRSIDTTARHPGTSSEIRTSTQAAITKAGLTDSAASTSISTNGTTDSTRHSTAMDETITINSTHMQVHVGTEATIVAEDVSTMLSINSTSLSPISTSYISDHRMSSSLVTSPPATETGISSPIYPSSLLSSASVKGLSTVASNHSVTNVTENNNLLSTVTSSPATHYPTSRTFSAKRDDYISSTVQLTTQDDSHGISTAVEFATRLIPNSTEYLSTTMFHVNSTTNISDRPTSAAWTEGGPVELNGQLRLRRQWMRDLENPTSEEYRRLDSQISTIITDIFQSSKLNEYFLSVTSINFRRGSVIVTFTALFTAGAPLDIQYLHDLFLREILNGTRFPDLDVDPESIKFEVSSASVTLSSQPPVTSRSTQTSVIPAWATGVIIAAAIVIIVVITAAIVVCCNSSKSRSRNRYNVSDLSSPAAGIYSPRDGGRFVVLVEKEPLAVPDDRDIMMQDFDYQNTTFKSHRQESRESAIELNPHADNSSAPIREPHRTNRTSPRSAGPTNVPLLAPSQNGAVGLDNPSVPLGETAAAAVHGSSRSPRLSGSSASGSSASTLPARPPSNAGIEESRNVDQNGSNVSELLRVPSIAVVECGPKQEHILIEMDPSPRGSHEDASVGSNMDIRWYSQAEYLDWDGSLVSGDPETSSFIGLLQRPELYGSVITYGENDPTRTVYDRELDVWQTDL